MARANQSSSRNAALNRSIFIATECAPLAYNHTVPIFREWTEDGQPRVKSFGSGVLVRINNKPILFTAGHVLDEVVQKSTQAGLSTGGPGTRGVPLLYEKAASNILPGTPRSRSDHLDVGAFLLKAEIAAALSNRFAPQSIVEPNDNEQNGNQYLLVGFPASRKNQRLKHNTATARCFNYGTSLYRMSRGEPRGYDQETEILIDYSKGNNFSARLEKRTAAHPRGMSGCGIWRTYTQPEVEHDWTSREMRLVGIAHTHSERLAIVRGTRIGIYLEMVRSKLL